MINAWDVYLVSQLDNFIAFFRAVGSLGFLISFTMVIIYWVNLNNFPESKPLKTAGMVGKILIIPMVLLIIISVALPSTKTAVAMWGVPKIVNDENIQEIPQNTAKLINEKLKSWLQENMGE